MPRALFLICCLVVSTPALALRCGNAVVSTGDTTLHLLRHCGEPALKEQHERRAAIRRFDPFRGTYYDDFSAEPYEVWTYNFGPRRFVQLITIERGKVKSIESAGYGY
jgi:hypothetical protein